jgi:hypothetical protein
VPKASTETAAPARRRPAPRRTSTRRATSPPSRSTTSLAAPEPSLMPEPTETGEPES